jgi:transcriptional regulator with XRE-family HTH domain
MLNEEKRGECVYFENNAVGKTIRMLRTNKQISQEILSGMSGIARTHLTMIENGTKKANFETLCRIAFALDLKPSELVAEIEKIMETDKRR